MSPLQQARLKRLEAGAVSIPHVSEAEFSAQASKAQALAELLASFSAPAQAIDEGQLIALIKKHATVTHSVEVVQAQAVTRVDSAHPKLGELLDLMVCRLNVYLVGPAGSGKTTLAKQAASALALPFFYTGAILQKYELMGFIDARGQLVRTPFRDAYENGGVFLFDELDACGAEALTAFNGALANGICAFPDGVIAQHPNFYCIATGNTDGKGATFEYQGRNALDAATLDRFVFLGVDYDKALELSLSLAEFRAYGGTNTNHLQAFVECLQGVREKLASSGALISPRMMLAGARLMGRGKGIHEVLDLVLYPKLTNDQKSLVKGR